MMCGANMIIGMLSVYSEVVLLLGPRCPSTAAKVFLGKVLRWALPGRAVQRTHTHTHTHTGTHTHTCIHTHAHVHPHKYTLTHIHIGTHACTRTYKTHLYISSHFIIRVY